MRLLLLAIVVPLLALAARADIIYDTMGMVDDQTYDTGNGNAISGDGVFGAIYDLQVADDFSIPAGGMHITAVMQGSLTLAGQAPQDLAIRIYADAGGVPAEDALWEKLVVADLGGTLGTESFEDEVFGFYGLKLSAIGLDIALAEGTYWIDLQPIDLSDSGDWFYQVRDLELGIGAVAAFRDGKSGYPGGYGVDVWTTFADAGDAAMRIEGVVPEPSAFALLSIGALVAMLRRR